MKLVASTGDLYSRGLQLTWKAEFPDKSVSATVPQDCVFKWCQWTPDGSSIVSASEDQGLRMFVVPHNVLSSGPLSSTEPSLKPFSRRILPSNILSTAIFPQFSLADSTSQYAAVSTRDMPVKLYNLAVPEMTSPLSYLCMHSESDLVAPIYAVAFGGSGSDVVLSCGTKHKLALFDIHRPGSEPLMEMRSKGILSALAHKPLDQSVIAAGRFDGSCALFDASSGQVICDNLGQSEQEGAMQLIWLPGDDYIIQVSRNSGELCALDTRMSLRPAFKLRGWDGMTSQRLTCSLSPDTSTLYGGGVSGGISAWKDLARAVDTDASAAFHAHGSCATSVSVNPIPRAALVASCSGTRSDEPVDCSLKLWDAVGVE